MSHPELRKINTPKSFCNFTTSLNSIPGALEANLGLSDHLGGGAGVAVLSREHWQHDLLPRGGDGRPAQVCRAADDNVEVVAGLDSEGQAKVGYNIEEELMTLFVGVLPLKASRKERSAEEMLCACRD